MVMASSNVTDVIIRKAWTAENSGNDRWLNDAEDGDDDHKAVS